MDGSGGPGPKRQRTAVEELRAWANEWPIKERVVGILEIFDDGIRTQKILGENLMCHAVSLLAVKGFLMG